ncbi:hypothetical protein GCM10027418_00280 [Mariniluteicoccus endophyticus]
MAAAVIACAGCGRRCGSEVPPWTWTRSVDGERISWLCEDCVRDHARDIEAKLPDDWWE